MTICGYPNSRMQQERYGIQDCRYSSSYQACRRTHAHSLRCWPNTRSLSWYENKNLSNCWPREWMGFQRNPQDVFPHRLLTQRFKTVWNCNMASNYMVKNRVILQFLKGGSDKHPFVTLLYAATAYQYARQQRPVSNGLAQPTLEYFCRFDGKVKNPVLSHFFICGQISSTATQTHSILAEKVWEQRAFEIS